MDRVSRSDRVTVDLTRAVPHANGWIDAPGHLPVIGAFDYPEFGTVELVPAETAHDPAALASLLGIPLTIDHPAGSMLDSTNTRELAHGSLLSATPVADGYDVTVRVWSEDAKAAGRGGKLQLSLGYECGLDAQAGTDPASGRAYTSVQRDRRYNHLAMVDLARVGGNARLRFDAMQTRKLTHAGRTFTIAALLATALEGQVVPEAKRKDAAIETAEITIDGVVMVLPRAVVDQIIAMLSGGGGPAPTEPVDAAPVDPNAVDPNAPPRMDGLSPAIAQAIRAIVREETASTYGRMDAASRQRMEVERQAGEILGPTFDYDTADTWEIAAATIAHVDAKAKAGADALAGKARKGDQLAAGRLLGRFDSAVEAHQADYDNGGELAVAIDTARRDGAAQGAADDEADDEEHDSEVARQSMLDRIYKRGDHAPGARQRAAAKAGADA